MRRFIFYGSIGCHTTPVKSIIADSGLQEIGLRREASKPHSFPVISPKTTITKTWRIIEVLFSTAQKHVIRTLRGRIANLCAHFSITLAT